MSGASEEQKTKLLACEIMKENTSEIIRKMESQAPLFFQNYSNIYTQYLHMLDDIFGACYIAEKEFLDNLDMDQKILKQIKENTESLKNTYLQNIEMASKVFDEYAKMRVESIKSFDNYAHAMMDSYAKMLSQFRKSS